MKYKVLKPFLTFKKGTIFTVSSDYKMKSLLENGLIEITKLDN